MNAALATERPRSTAITMPRSRIARVGLLQRASAVRRRTWLIYAFAASIALLLALCVANGWGLSGYFGVFGFSVLTNAMLFLLSGLGAVMVAGAMVLNPLAVAVLTGTGGAIGELTGYALGRSTRNVIKKGKLPAWLNRIAERHMAITILAISIIPSPFVNAIGIVAGRVGYPVGRFLAYSMAGKVVQSIAFVYLALWYLSLLSSLTGIGQQRLRLDSARGLNGARRIRPHVPLSSGGTAFHRVGLPAPKLGALQDRGIYAGHRPPAGQNQRDLFPYPPPPPRVETGRGRGHVGRDDHVVHM